VKVTKSAAISVLEWQFFVVKRTRFCSNLMILCCISFEISQFYNYYFKFIMYFLIEFKFYSIFKPSNKILVYHIFFK